MVVDGVEVVVELLVPVAAGALLVVEVLEPMELQAARPSSAKALAVILKTVITRSSIATVWSPSGTNRADGAGVPDPGP